MKRSKQNKEKSRKVVRVATTSKRDSQHEEKVGFIERISLFNFMCHSNLDFQFGPNVNFVIGRNGSGKSAVLTGLVVALGGKANATGRGSNLRSFIMHGKQSAQISVTLRNQGTDAFKPEDYGDVITVERRISGDGASSYKLIGQRGNVISTKRDELIHILDQFNIQVENPVAVLNQETSRNFLNSKSPQDKYQFFMKATQLGQIRDGYAIALEYKHNIRDMLTKNKSVLQDIEREVNVWEQKWRAHQCFDEQRKKVRDLQGEFSWAVVGTKESAVAGKQEAIQNRREELWKYEKRMDDMSKLEIRKQEKLAAVQEQLQDIKKKLSDLQTRRSHAKSVLEEHVKELRTQKLDMRRLVNENANAKEEEENQLRHIETLRPKESNIVVEKERRMMAVQALEEKKDTLVARLRTTEVHLEKLNGSILQYEDDISSLKQEIIIIERQADSIKSNLGIMESSRTNQLKRYGQHMPELLNQIETSFTKREFKVKPKGPIGAYINLKDESLAIAIEMNLGNLIFSFCCDNHDDERVLIKLINNTIRDGPKPSIVVSPFQTKVYNVESFRVYAPPYHSILDVLNIEDPVIANCLIDQRNIESVLLIPESREARQIMLHQPPKNCLLAFTKSGDRLHPNPFRYYSSNKTRARFLQGSTEDKIRELRAELSNVQGRHRTVTSKLEELQSNFRSNQQEQRNQESQKNNIRREIEKLKLDIHTLQTSEDTEPGDVRALEDDVINNRKLREELKTKIADLERIIGKENEKTALMQNDYKSICEEIDHLIEMSEPLKLEMKNIDAEVQVLRHQYRRVNTKLNEFKEIIQGLEEEHARAAENLNNIRSKAEIVCPKVQTNRTPIAIENEIEQIKKQLQLAESIQGSKEEVTMKFLAVKRKYDRFKNAINSYTETYKALDSALVLRKERYTIFRNQLTLRIKILFLTSLAQRNFDGKMIFNHKEGTLDILMQPRQNVQELNKDMRSLSGGERSFTTMCFIFALWDAMESPIRILDEFDVFMDMVNRRISMDMMLDTATHKLDTQFIFLTPLDMTRMTSNLVRICKMPDPVRSLQLLAPRIQDGSCDQ